MNMFTLSTILKYYKRPEIRNALVDNARNKEVVGSFKGQGFGKRPDILQYANDVLALVKDGVTSFHASEELWTSPLRLQTEMKKHYVDELRLGWDLVLDIDCQELEYSKLAGYLLVEALKHHGIKGVSVKFSGNHGFHIGVPWESFPAKVNGQDTKYLFPEAPRKIANYLKEMIKKHLCKMLLDKHNIEQIASKIGKDIKEITDKEKLDVFKVLDIDTILISPRHLYRMAYSFNEKSGLISLPIDPDKIIGFDKSNAASDKVEVNEYRFLDRSIAREDEASNLIIQAFDFNPSVADGAKLKKDYEIPEEAIPTEMFPPCIVNILNGIEDGRKRAVFILLNFLRSSGWGYENIDQLLSEWNNRNREQLREVIWRGQLRHHKQIKKNILPPNCANKMYMVGIGVCTPDGLCGKIRNPAQYSKLKSKLANQGNRKWSNEKKERMRKIREDRNKFKEEVQRKKESGEI